MSWRCSVSCSPMHTSSDRATRAGVLMPNTKSTSRPTGNGGEPAVVGQLLHRLVAARRVWSTRLASIRALKGSRGRPSSDKVGISRTRMGWVAVPVVGPLELGLEPVELGQAVALDLVADVVGQTGEPVDGQQMGAHPAGKEAPKPPGSSPSEPGPGSRSASRSGIDGGAPGRGWHVMIRPSYSNGDQRFTTVIHRDLAGANIPPEQGYCPFRMVLRRRRSGSRRTVCSTACPSTPGTGATRRCPPPGVRRSGRRGPWPANGATPVRRFPR